MRENKFKNIICVVILIAVGYANLALASPSIIYSDQEVIWDVYCYYDGNGDLAFNYCFAGGSYFCNCAEEQTPEQ